MRRFFLMAAFVALPFLPMTGPTAMLDVPAVAVAADEASPTAPKLPDIDVNVDRTERHVISFANPTALAIGAGIVVLIVALIAMSSRGGGTTIVKE